MTASSNRIASVDIFRALTMLIMLWVNDFAGMAGIPHWLHHAAATEDMLGFSDIVFPAFLFCVGMSIPFAIRTRYRKGDSHLQVILHIVARALALLIMGIFAMNLKGVEGGLSHNTFTLLSVVGFFLLWNAYPKKDGRNPWWTVTLRALGAALLLFLVIYKDCHGMPFKAGWWGILGIIGWAYLICALVNVFIKGSFKGTVIFWIVSVLLCVLNKATFIPSDFSSRALLLNFYPVSMTHVSLVASGMLASALLARFAEGTEKRHDILLSCLIGLGVVMFALGLVSHKFWIISKIKATPTWFFFCTAIYFPLIALLYWIADIKGKTAWARPISPAGTATLTCYTIPYIWSAVQGLLGAWWPEVLSDGALGLVRSVVFSFIIIFLTWVFGKCGVKMKI